MSSWMLLLRIKWLLFWIDLLRIFRRFWTRRLRIFGSS